VLLTACRTSPSALNVDTMGGVTTTTPAQQALRLRRAAGGAAREWTDPSTSPTRHNMRVDRLKSTWPALATSLDHLAEIVEKTPLAEVAGQVEAAVLCPLCNSPLARLKIGPNPRTAQPQHIVEPCGHLLDRDQALALWERGLPTDVTKINAAALIAAEQVRQREEEGYTPESDADLDPGALAWAAWALIDRATSGRMFNDEVPTMWPLPPERWKPQGKTPARLLIIAAALIGAEIDARLAAGEAV
jgi:hypothetical protein